jgi:biopolymer transport protein ExbD
MISIPSPRSRRKARIEIIPLIDIIFFLFATFVMVSLSMVRNHGIAVNLPAAATGSPQERSRSAVVSIAADGGLFFNKRAVSPDQLRAALEDFAAANPDPTIFINGDARANLGGAISALDCVRSLGITKVAIETRPLSPARP